MNIISTYRNEFNNILNDAPLSEPERQFYFIDKCHDILIEKEQETGRRLKACINTFGCQMNAKDSEKLSGVLSRIGYVVTEDESADLVLYNTCTVREHANIRVYGRLGVLKTEKEKNPEMIIALCGCMMQEADVVNKIKDSYSFVDIIFGTHNIYKLAELLFMHFMSDDMQVDILNEPEKVVEDLPSVKKHGFKTGVNIMYGCDNFCSYCIVPYVRGRERSRRPEDILDEIKMLAEDGTKEIMLLGQNVNSYGKNFIDIDEPINTDFPKLLKKVEDIEGIERIRFMTSHPKDLSDELIDVIHSSKKICRHIHLPLQSGSNDILKKMNRHYTKEDYLKLVEKIRSSIDDVSVTTDIIVGFPTETDDDFNETLDVVKKARFDSAFTFIYSKRSGTKAALMDGQIDSVTVKKRFDTLLETVNIIAKEQNKKYAGRVFDVLVEDINKKDKDLLSGRLSNNSIVHFKGSADLIGEIINVRLDEPCGFYYMGSIVD